MNFAKVGKNWGGLRFNLSLAIDNYQFKKVGDC